MHTTVHTSLIRQSKALALLCELMEEEYQTLLGHNTDAVVALEFSIQELIRQLAAEKATIMKALAGVRAKEYAASLPQAEGAALLARAQRMPCARNFNKNATRRLCIKRG